MIKIKLERIKRWLTKFLFDKTFDRQMEAVDRQMEAVGRKELQAALLTSCLKKTDLLLFLFDGGTLNKDALRLYVDAKRQEFVDPGLTYEIVIGELVGLLDGHQFIQVLIELPKILDAPPVQINAD